MGKAALIAVASFAAMSTYYFTSSKTGMLRASERIADHQYETLARGAALNGFNLARQALSESFASQRLDGIFDRASYEVDVRVSCGRAVVVAMAEVPSASGSETAYRMRAEFERRSLAPRMADAVPDFMDYAVISEEDLRISGNAGAAVVYASGSDLNANFHTNEDLRVDGKGTKIVAGYGTHAGSALGRHRDFKFRPRTGDDDPTHEASRVDIPAFDVAEYEAFATRTSGASSISGLLEGGSREEPMVWLVNGDLDVGDLVVDGYVVFLVAGDIDVDGNTRVGASGYAEKDESSVAFYSDGDIDIRGSSEVWAQLYAEDEFEIGGRARLYGSVAALGSARIEGDPTFHYREASPALTTIWNGESGGMNVRMTAFFEQ